MIRPRSGFPIFLCLLAIFFIPLAQVPASAAPTPELPKESCSSLIQTFRGTLPPLAKGEADLADCGSVAAATIGATGKYPYWLGCLNYGEMPDNAHIARCVMLARVVLSGSRENLTPLQQCEPVLAAYEESLRAASETGELPSSYARPTCDTVAKAVILWTGMRSAWLRCRGYDDRAAEAAHAASCLLDDPRLGEVREGRNLCVEVRRLYEERLSDAYGKLPEGYRALRCSNAQPIVREVERQLAALKAARQQRALQIAAQRVQARQAGTSIDVGKLVYAFMGIMQLGQQFVGQLQDQAGPVVDKVRAQGKAAATKLRDQGQEILDTTNVISPEDLVGFGANAPYQEITVETKDESLGTIDIEFNLANVTND